jgi:hypothetical protein
MSAPRRRFVFTAPEKRHPAGTVFKNSLREWRQRSQAKLAGQQSAPDKGSAQAPPT